MIVRRREPLDLMGVVGLCARRRAESLMFFETLGGWTQSDDSYAPAGAPDDPFARDDPGAGTVRRRFAMATHRHAWHAELWAARMPSIPGVDVLDRTAIARAQIDTDDLTSGDSTARRSAYAARITAIVTELDEISRSVHADLDPSTHRVIDLVRADLVGIRNASW